MSQSLQDSAAFLKEAFSERSRSNPRYSLRAFARTLGLSPGGLSQILSRKKRLSADRAHDIARRLGLDGDEAECFRLLVELEGAGSLSRKAELRAKLDERQGERPTFDLGIDQFRLISEWYGFAVLTLFTDCARKPSTGEAARLLGIGQAEVEAMLERLQRLEVIELLPGLDAGDPPRFRRVDGIMFKSVIPNEALRNYYRGLLRQCDESLEAQTPRERVSGAQIFAFDPSQIDEARDLTDRYLNDLAALATRGKDRTELYQAVSHVFRLTKSPMTPTSKPKPRTTDTSRRKEIP